MDTNYADNNYLILVGRVANEKKFSHEVYGESFFLFNLEFWIIKIYYFCLRRKILVFAFEKLLKWRMGFGYKRLYPDSKEFDLWKK